MTRYSRLELAIMWELLRREKLWDIPDDPLPGWVNLFLPPPQIPDIPPDDTLRPGYTADTALPVDLLTYRNTPRYPSMV